MKRWKKIVAWFFIIVTILLIVVVIYANSLIGVNAKAIDYLDALNIEMRNQGYVTNYYVISGKRWKLHNDFLVRFGGAARRSQHLKGNAIDLIVFDVNRDGKSNKKDIDIVYNILNKKIIKHKGGIGTYKNASDFFTQQMIHFDCRGKRARWHR